MTKLLFAALSLCTLGCTTAPRQACQIEAYDSYFTRSEMENADDNTDVDMFLSGEIEDENNCELL